jgi:hypothetical protein
MSLAGGQATLRHCPACGYYGDKTATPPELIRDERIRGLLCASKHF